MHLQAYGEWPFGVSGGNRNMGSHGGKDNDNYFYNTSSTGGSAPFNVMPPYAVVNYLIKY